jgi:hypothetical protein
MFIEHGHFLSCVHGRRAGPTYKSHAQDGGRLFDVTSASSGAHAKSASCDPAMALVFWMACILPMVRAIALSLQARATGALPVIVQLPDCG